MERLFLQMRYLANHLRVAVIEGEVGTGKLLTARTLHILATDATCGFVPCSASEFLRGERACIPGEQSAILEEARGGTLYLSRVDLLNTEEQGQLLQLLEWHQHQHTRDGSQARSQIAPGQTAPRQTAPKQIVVSCERPLRGLVLQGRMRADLSYHLTSVRLLLPALRERREDIPLLVDHFLGQFSERHGKPLRGLGPGVLNHLVSHSWPGNVRELETTLCGAALMCESQWIRLIDLPLLSASPQNETGLFLTAGTPGAKCADQHDQSGNERAGNDHAGNGRAAKNGQGDQDDPNLDHVILRHIHRVLASVNGNKLRAAGLLGISRSTLYRLLETNGVSKD
jgi:DNA-binding NtrC family response regulator